MRLAVWEVVRGLGKESQAGEIFFLAMPLALQYHDTSPKPAMISAGT